MTLFNSSRFLCWSMPSIGVTTTSPKNSLSFNMSPTSAIIFIKCQNGYQMKIIFLIREDNNSQRCYFAWENLRGGFCDVGCCCSLFIVVAVLHSFLFFICRCSSFTFAFWHHPSPFRGLSTSFYTHFIISAEPISQSVLRHFHFQSFRYFLAAGTMVLIGHFFTHGHFLPYAPSLVFYLRLTAELS